MAENLLHVAHMNSKTQQAFALFGIETFDELFHYDLVLSCIILVTFTTIFLGKKRTEQAII